MIREGWFARRKRRRRRSKATATLVAEVTRRMSNFVWIRGTGKEEDEEEDEKIFVKREEVRHKCK